MLSWAPWPSEVSEVGSWSQISSTRCLPRWLQMCWPWLLPWLLLARALNGTQPWSCGRPCTESPWGRTWLPTTLPSAVAKKPSNGNWPWNSFRTCQGRMWLPTMPPSALVKRACSGGWQSAFSVRWEAFSEVWKAIFFDVFWFPKWRLAIWTCRNPPKGGLHRKKLNPHWPNVACRPNSARKVSPAQSHHLHQQHHFLQHVFPVAPSTAALPSNSWCRGAQWGHQRLWVCGAGGAVAEGTGSLWRNGGSWCGELLGGLFLRKLLIVLTCCYYSWSIYTGILLCFNQYSGGLVDFS